MDSLQSLASILNRHRKAPESAPIQRPLYRYCYKRYKGEKNCKYWKK